MMQVAYQTLRLNKKFPLAISRGVSAGGDNLFVSVTRDGVTGVGEMAPGRGAPSAASGEAALKKFLADDDLAGLSVEKIYDHGRRLNVPACALAALDIALWDCAARKAGVPLYRFLNFNQPRAPTSVTIGISTPTVVRERIPLLLNGTGVRALKVKLGAPDGVDADRAMFAAVTECVADRPVSVRVDANGGWGVDDARAMMKWLAARGVEYVEQPLAEGNERDLPAIYKNRPLPIFVDESCRVEDDLPAFADAVDGVNIKLMKCGGVTGALRIIKAAKARNLKTMIGCMNESSLAISAAAALTGALDYVDLDSHLNLNPDPCTGAKLIDGVVTPNESPGHGAKIIDAD